MQAKILLGLSTLFILVFASAGLSAQSGNQVAVYKTWATVDPTVAESARTITVTVNDRDLDQAVPIEDQGPDRVGKVFSMPAGSDNGDTLTLSLDEYPIVDRSGDGVTNNLDVDVVVPGTNLPVDIDGDTTTDIVVQDVEEDDGVVVVRVVDSHNGDPFGNAVPFQLNYNSAVFNDTTDAAGAQPVVVATNQDAEGFGLRLRETNATSGLYRATFIVINDASAIADLDPTNTNLYNTFDETGVGVDLNADGDVTDKAVAVGLYEAAYGGADLSGDAAVFVAAGAVDEAVTGTDINGDGDAVDVALNAGVFYEAAYGTDLNGDGDALDAVSQYDAALFPDGKRPFIRVAPAANDQATVTYSDLDSSLQRTGATSTDIVGIEALAPSFSGLSPVTGAATTSIVPKLQADVTDAESGVSETSISIEVHNWSDANSDGKVQDAEVGLGIPGSPFDQGGSFLSTIVISGGFRAQVTLPAQPPLVDLAWRVLANDVAGNGGTSDADASDADVNWAALSIDNVPPALVEAFTGHTWDATTSSVIGDVDFEPDSWTSVRVVFHERLNPASVVPTDFKVAGVTPGGADTFGPSVFLTVNPMAPNAKPLVELVGTIADRAGNELNAGPEVTAADGIAPSITIWVDRPPESVEGRITLTSDEDIIGSPSIRLISEAGNVVLPGLSNPAIRIWERIFDPALVGGSLAEFTVVAQGSDATGNLGQSELTTTLTQGSINVTVVLQGQTEHDGAVVTIDGPESYVVTTDPSGIFIVSLAPGTYSLTAEYFHSVPAVATVVVREGRPTIVQTVLLKGDFNGDGTIDLLDLVGVAGNFGATNSGWEESP